MVRAWHAASTQVTLTAVELYREASVACREDRLLYAKVSTAAPSAALDNVLDDVALRGVVEHQGRRKVHPQLLVERVPERHAGEAVHASFHERVVQAHFLVAGQGPHGGGGDQGVHVVPVNARFLLLRCLQRGHGGRRLVLPM